MDDADLVLNGWIIGIVWFFSSIASQADRFQELAAWFGMSSAREKPVEFKMRTADGFGRWADFASVQIAALSCRVDGYSFRIAMNTEDFKNFNGLRLENWFEP